MEVTAFWGTAGFYAICALVIAWIRGAGPAHEKKREEQFMMFMLRGFVAVCTIAFVVILLSTG